MSQQFENPAVIKGSPLIAKTERKKKPRGRGNAPYLKARRKLRRLVF